MINSQFPNTSLTFFYHHVHSRSLIPKSYLSTLATKMQLSFFSFDFPMFLVNCSLWILSGMSLPLEFWSLREDTCSQYLVFFLLANSILWIGRYTVIAHQCYFWSYLFPHLFFQKSFHQSRLISQFILFWLHSLYLKK